ISEIRDAFRHATRPKNVSDGAIRGNAVSTDDVSFIGESGEELATFGIYDKEVWTWCGPEVARLYWKYRLATFPNDPVARHNASEPKSRWRWDDSGPVPG
ncbi:MAG TPA: hypothetical protein VKT78_02065, partial [Fimbriimonadaceae bacterium]|nr:hypothetical protein [Fimbriimonadaceae bacterium]